MLVVKSKMFLVCLTKSKKKINLHTPKNITKVP